LEGSCGMTRAWLIFVLVGVLPVWGSNVTSSHVVDCGGTRAVPFDETVSKDGRFAFGWTIKARHAGVKPVDWSQWSAEDPEKFLEAYVFDAESVAPGAAEDYGVVDCLIDLQARTLVELPSEQPNYPGKNRGYSVVAWSEPSEGHRYALIENDARFGTANLWLIRIDGDGVEAMDLAPQLNKAVDPVLREKRPLLVSAYATFFLLASSEKPEENAAFNGETATVPFTSDIPKSLDESSAVEGTLTLQLPEGSVMKTVCTTERDDPLEDVPELAKADGELNRVYGALQQKLGADERARLKTEQLGWIELRDSGAFDAYQAAQANNDGNPKEARNQALLKATKERTAELEKRVGGKD